MQRSPKGKASQSFVNGQGGINPLHLGRGLAYSAFMILDLVGMPDAQ